MENSFYGTHLFVDESPIKANQQFNSFLDSCLKDGTEVISSNMFYAPFFDDPTKYNFFIHVLYKYKRIEI